MNKPENSLNKYRYNKYGYSIAGKEKVYDVNRQNIFASAQIIAFNPILKESVDIRTQYFMYLRKLIREVRWDKRKYTKAQIKFYQDTLCGDPKVSAYTKEISFSPRFCYLLPYDLAAMLAFQSKIVNSGKVTVMVDKIAADFNLPKEHAEFLSLEFKAALGDPLAWDSILRSNLTKGFKRYLKLVKKNINFIQARPYNILITATMSAGKSTLLNSLVGKNISLMQNLACTSKIHTIISKPLEDGVSSEYDHNLSMDASEEELLRDDDENKSHKITVGTYFNGELGGKRIIFFDSPGVNSSENKEHTEISRRMIKSRKYHLMIYVLNATQLGTTDEEHHLEIVKQMLGRGKIIFVLNKADKLISKDDNFLDSIDSQRRFLVSKGFKKPLICPISCRAAYLVKKSKTEGLSRIERSEIENFMDKFEVQRLSDYYEKTLGCPHLSANNEVDTLFVNCGFAHFERIIINLYDGGRTNGTGVC